jgi:exonuclease III
MFSKFILACWNVRGLGHRVKRDDVRAAIESFLPVVLCLQETKLPLISPFFASSFLPPSLRTFIFKPSIGASGGILTDWNDQVVELIRHSIDDFSISTTFSLRADNLTFSIINVYGPCIHDQKQVFLSSVQQLFATFSGPVAILGDFNLIRSPRDKSNNNFNAAEASSFNEFINSLGLLEIPLLDRQFTWSNQQDPPILARLDRVLVNPEWSFALPDTTLTSSARPTSDHVPLHLAAATKAPRSTLFRMENSWLSNQDLTPIISNNWSSVGPNHSHLSNVGRLCLRLKRVRAAIKSWARARRLPSLYLVNCRAVISFLDRLEEARNLSTLESRLRVLAKK